MTTQDINGLEIGNKLKAIKNGTSSYFLQDHLGSTVGLANTSGNLTEATDYDTFGNATNSLSTRYQFTGREFDVAAGLHYYRARWYDAQIGRFISEDPIGFGGGDVNLYGYVWNNPQNWTDPSGHFPGPPLIGVFFPFGRGTPSEQLDKTQLLLGTAGMLPGVGEPFDAADGLISLGRGNYGDAALSGMSMIPFIGWGAGITKICSKADNVANGTNVVYQGFNRATGAVEYVGITKRSPNVRFGEHLNSGTGKALLDYEVVEGATNLSRMDARILEQTLINQHGMNNLLNVRNSIAPKFWSVYGIQ